MYILSWAWCTLAAIIIVVVDVAVVQNLQLATNELTHCVYSKRFAKNNPDSDHFDENSAITESVAK
jgi:hypothetical protein